MCINKNKLVSKNSNCSFSYPLSLETGDLDWEALILRLEEGDLEKKMDQSFTNDNRKNSMATSIRLFLIRYLLPLGLDHSHVFDPGNIQ